MNANTENEIGFWLPYGVFIFGVVMMFTGIQPDGYIVFFFSTGWLFGRTQIKELQE